MSAASNRPEYCKDQRRKKKIKDFYFPPQSHEPTKKKNPYSLVCKHDRFDNPRKENKTYPSLNFTLIGKKIMSDEALDSRYLVAAKYPTGL